jgi:hypothetical protein
MTGSSFDDGTGALDSSTKGLDLDPQLLELLRHDLVEPATP